MRFISAKLTIKPLLIKPLLIVFMWLLNSDKTMAQTPVQLSRIVSTKSDSLPEVVRCFGDSLSSSFVIYIRHRVKMHKHLRHSEHVYVLEGKGEMQLADTLFQIVPGMLVFIPSGTPHSARRKGKKVLKVLSIQSPYFDGSDRLLLEQRP